MDGFGCCVEIKPCQLMRVALERQLHIAAFIIVCMFFKRIVMDEKTHERNARIQLLVFPEMFNQYRNLQQLRQRKHIRRNRNQQDICENLFHRPKSRLSSK